MNHPVQLVDHPEQLADHHEQLAVHPGELVDQRWKKIEEMSLDFLSILDFENPNIADFVV